MNEQHSAIVYTFPRGARRGRPPGSTNSYERKLQDRVRTVVTLEYCLLQVTCVDNVSQFSRWFDEVMQTRYPGRTWDTYITNKWRKNFKGSVALSPEWIQYLDELFPDGRYYGRIDGSVDGLKTEALFPVASAPRASEGARAMFDNGPDDLWKAIWHKYEDADELWNLWSITDYEEVAGDFEAALNILEMRAYGDYSCSYSHAPMTYEDLTRAVTLYRIFNLSEPYTYPFGWGVRVYLCLKIIMADCSRDLYSMMPDIAKYFASVESERLDLPRYHGLSVEYEWRRQGMTNIPSNYEFANNPFFSLSDQTKDKHLRFFYDRLACITFDLMR